MKDENINQEFKDYIHVAIKNGITRESIVTTLLSKGWLLSEIKNEMAENSSITDNDFMFTDTKKRKAWFAMISVVLFIFAVGLFYLGQGILSVLASFSGIVLGVIGVKSTKKVYAIFGLILNLLAFIFVVFMIGSVFYMIRTEKVPFSGKPLTQQQKVDFGISEYIK